MPQGFSRTAHAAWCALFTHIADVTGDLSLRAIREAHRSRRIADGEDPAGTRRRAFLCAFAPLSIVLAFEGVAALALIWIGWPRAALIPVAMAAIAAACEGRRLYRARKAQNFERGS